MLKQVAVFHCSYDCTSRMHEIVHMDSQIIIMQTFFLQKIQPDMQVFLWGSQTNYSGYIYISQHQGQCSGETFHHLHCWLLGGLSPSKHVWASLGFNGLTFCVEDKNESFESVNSELKSIVVMGNCEECTLKFCLTAIYLLPHF